MTALVHSAEIRNEGIRGGVDMRWCRRRVSVRKVVMSETSDMKKRSDERIVTRHGVHNEIWWRFATIHKSRYRNWTKHQNPALFCGEI